MHSGGFGDYAPLIERLQKPNFTHVFMDIPAIVIICPPHIVSPLQPQTAHDSFFLFTTSEFTTTTVHDNVKF